MQWNLADLFELVADTAPGRVALAHGARGVTRTWAELDRRANALARHFVRRHPPGAKVAIYAYPGPSGWKRSSRL
jgi:non-ribosomal peptide synthetase component F